MTRFSSGLKSGRVAGPRVLMVSLLALIVVSSPFSAPDEEC